LLEWKNENDGKSGFLTDNNRTLHFWSRAKPVLMNVDWGSNHRDYPWKHDFKLSDRWMTGTWYVPPNIPPRGTRRWARIHILFPWAGESQYYFYPSLVILHETPPLQAEVSEIRTAKKWRNLSRLRCNVPRLYRLSYLNIQMK